MYSDITQLADADSLSGRRQYVSINDIKSPNKIIEYEISQGFILGPLLFLIHMNDLPPSLLIVRRFFADDNVLLISGKSYKSVQMLANSKLAKASNWMMANNSIINTTITVALFISPNLRKPVTDLTLTFNNETVHPSNTTKY